MIVYLVRHAIAFERDPGKWPDDSRRPLAKKGEARFIKLARQLRKLGVGVEHTFSSGYLRAWQTAEILRDECGWPAPEKLAALEPGGSAPEVVKAASGIKAGAIALVGHEPSLSELLAFLLVGRDAPALGSFKKGGVACLEFSAGPAAGGGALRWLVTPKVLLGQD